ncbi:MAG TPA: alpha/beta family hydrolase [Candidatus Acidoferrales bacterium]|nr:alpha/beta family hydrolase [Candidatus Acidoferrales bacterium]
MTRQLTKEGKCLEREVSVDAGKVMLEGTLGLPDRPAGIVIFAHGSGSSRQSPRNRYVAGVLQSQGMATLLFDLLTREEEPVDEYTRALRFDIPLLTERLVGATRWLMRHSETRGLKIGYFGASTGAAAALRAAAELQQAVATIVSRGGRPDLAGDALAAVRQPALLIVGERDEQVIEMNREALEQLSSADSKLVIIPGATHLFEETGALEEVARLAAAWFKEHLAGVGAKPVGSAAGRP